MDFERSLRRRVPPCILSKNNLTGKITFPETCITEVVSKKVNISKDIGEEPK